MSARYRGGRETFTDEEAEFRRALESVPPPTPPEGGWGWVVVFSSFLTNAIVDGICYSYGMLVPQLLGEPHSSLVVVSLGGSLLLSTYMISGPVSSALCNKFGSRRIAMVGSFFSTLAVAFSPSLYPDARIFVIVFGIFGGIGFGMMFLSSMLIVGFYFEKHRSIAATIAMCGSSLGMAIIAPLITVLLDEYQWKGTVLILSGLIANGMVMGCLLRPLDADLRRRKKIIIKRMEEDKKIGPHTCIIMQKLLEEKRRQKTISTGSLNNGVITRDNLLIRERDLSRHNPVFERFRGALSRSSLTLNSSKAPSPALPRRGAKTPSPSISRRGVPTINVTESPKRTRTRHPAAPNSSPRSLHKEVLLSNQLKSNSSLEWLQLSQQMEATPTGPRDTPTFCTQGIPNSKSQNQPSLRAANLPISPETTPPNACEPAPLPSCESATPTNGPTPELAEDATSLIGSDGTLNSADEEMIRHFLHVTPDGDRPMYRKDILYTGSVHRLPEYRHNIEEYIASITHVPDDAERDIEHLCWGHLRWLPKPVIDVLKTVLSRETCTSFTFLLLALSSSLAMLGYYVPFLLLPLYTQTQTGLQLTELQSALLIAVLGLGNTLGRITCGILGSKKWVDSLIINSVALLIGGACIMTLPFLREFSWMLLSVGCFGVCLAAFSSLRSVIVVELMGLDKLTSSFSQLIILHGLAVIIGTPISCLVAESFDNGLQYPFYISGGFMVLSGLLSAPLRKLSEWEKRRKGLYVESSEFSDAELKEITATHPFDTIGM